MEGKSKNNKMMNNKRENTNFYFNRNYFFNYMFAFKNYLLIIYKLGKLKRGEKTSFNFSKIQSSRSQFKRIIKC